MDPKKKDPNPIHHELIHLKNRVTSKRSGSAGGRSSSLEMLLESVEYMELTMVDGFQTYFNHGVGEGKAFANLAKLSISDCNDLEHLGISRLSQNYQPTRMRSFSKLTELRIEGSHGCKYLFCPSSARCLVQLRKLSIRYCPLMEEIIRPREQEEEEIIQFPNLEYMHLAYLTRLKSFFYCKKIINMWSDQNTSIFPVHYFFNAMVSFPVLEQLIMFGVGNVIEIWEPQCRTENSFSQLKILDVNYCDKLENVIPFAMLRRLQNMETLSVEFCSSLKCIVNGAKATTTEDQEGSGSEIVFPVLKTLKLTYMEYFWYSILQKVSFPRLEELLVVLILSEASDLVEFMGVNANLPRDHGIHHLLCFRGLKRLTVENCKLSTLHMFSG